MNIFANIAPDDLPLQGLLTQSLDAYGMKAKGSTKTYDLGTLLKTAHHLGVDAIFLTNVNTLKNIVSDPKPSLGDWRGSLITTSIPIVVSNPLAHINSIPTGKKIHQIDIHKLHKSPTTKKFLYNYTICTEYHHLVEAEEDTRRAAIIVIDIETTFKNKISSISFTCIKDNWTLGNTYVIQLNPWKHVNEAWQTVRNICSNPIAKAFHNGTFDCFHLLRFHVIVENYLWDTEYIWRCWHAELLKALDKIGSYILPDFYYWKYESEQSPLEYNAKDTINTARILLYILQYAPDWVWTNYAQLLPNIGPVLYTAFEGFLVDREKLKEARAKDQEILDNDLQVLRETIALPNFNPGSPKQVNALLYKCLKAKKPGRAKSESATGETELKAVARQHPLYALIVSKILSYREKKKAISTYYDAPLTDNDRLLYLLQLDGTETARMSCLASSLRILKPGKKTYVKTNMINLGTQIQNVPYYYKKALMADPEFKLINIDKSQSEARCVGYLSACKDLVDALEGPNDFYCYTGYRFFGIEFDKKHPLRQAVKRIIHGTNYLMGVLTFIDAVGLEELQEYKKLLSYRGTLINFVKHLLQLYHITYPEVKEGWSQTKIEILNTGRLVTPDGWVRLVEGDIEKHHSILRSVVAHKAQHWSVWGINRAFWKIFYELQVPSNGEFRLKAQIHDSIVAQIKEERVDYYSKEMKRIMDIPQECEYGVMRIPLDTEIGDYWK